MMKFSKGETVVEPTIGICSVFGMKIMKVDGQDMTVYIFDAQNAKVYVPADQVEKRGIRRPMNRDDVKRVLASLKRPASPNRADARLQYTNYRDIMKSGDPVKITNLLRDLYILDQNDDLKGKEKEIMDQARKFLTDEIAFVRDVSKTMIAETINEALRGMYKKKIQKDKERAKKSGVGLSMGVLGYEDDEEEYEEEEDELEIAEKAKKKKAAVVDEGFEEDVKEEDETDEGATLEDEAEEEEEFEEDKDE